MICCEDNKRPQELIITLVILGKRLYRLILLFLTVKYDKNRICSDKRYTCYCSDRNSITSRRDIRLNKSNRLTFVVQILMLCDFYIFRLRSGCLLGFLCYIVDGLKDNYGISFSKTGSVELNRNTTGTVFCFRNEVRRSCYRSTVCIKNLSSVFLEQSSYSLVLFIYFETFVTDRIHDSCICSNNNSLLSDIRLSNSRSSCSSYCLILVREIRVNCDLDSFVVKFLEYDYLCYIKRYISIFENYLRCTVRNGCRKCS